MNRWEAKVWICSGIGSELQNRNEIHKTRLRETNNTLKANHSIFCILHSFITNITSSSSSSVDYGDYMMKGIVTDPDHHYNVPLFITFIPTGCSECPYSSHSFYLQCVTGVPRILANIQYHGCTNVWRTVSIRSTSEVSYGHVVVLHIYV